MDERDVKAHAESATEGYYTGRSFKESNIGQLWNYVHELYRTYNEGYADKALEILELMHLQGETEGISMIDLDAEMDWSFNRKINNGRKSINLYKGRYEEDYTTKVFYSYFNRDTNKSGIKNLEEFGTLENLVKEFLNDKF